MEKFLTKQDGDLETVIRKNISIAHNIRSEIRRLSEIPIDSILSDEIIDIKKEEDMVAIDEGEEYSFYFDDIKEYLNKKDIVSEDDIYDMLPSIENKNYSNIIMRITLELKKEYK